MDTAAGTGGADTGYAIPINAAMAAERQITGRQQGQGISLGVDGFLGVIVGPGTARSPVAQQAQERSIAAGAAARRAHPAASPPQEDVTTPATIAPVPAGALVVGVLCGTGAATAGIAAGDVITAANGHQVESARRADRHRGRVPAGYRGVGHLGQHGRGRADLADPARPGPGRLNPLRCPAFPVSAA